MTDSQDPAAPLDSPLPTGDDLGGMRTLAGRVLFGGFAVALYLVVQFWAEIGKPWGPGASTLLAIAAFVLHVVLVRRRVGAIDPVIWLPVCLLIFYFGIPISLEFIYAHPPPLGYDSWNAEIGPPWSLDRGYCLALLTLVSFVWGTHLAGFKNLSQDPGTNLPRDEVLAPAAYIFTSGALLMVAAGIAIVGPSAVFGYYGDWWAAKAAGADARWIDVGLIFCGAGAFALIASATPEHRMRLYCAIAVLLLVTAINVQKGARGPIVVTGLGAGWCYTQRIRRLRWAPVLIGAVFMLIVMPALREWRAERSLEQTARTSSRDLIGSAVYGMGGTANVFGYSLDFIPSEKSYVYGMSFWGALVRAIPNFGLTPGKSWGKVEPEYHPSDWLTARVSPTWHDNGGGYGYAMGAEFFFNFGIIGVLLGVTGLAYLTGKIRNASRLSPVKLLAAALFFASTAIFIRDVFAQPLKLFLWPLAGLLIIRKAVSMIYGPPARAPVMGSGEGGRAAGVAATGSLPRLP